MSQLIKLKLGSEETIIVEASEEDEEIKKVNIVDNILDKTSKYFDRLVQQLIIDSCTVLINSFTQIKNNSLPPQKAKAEFGLQFNTDGNIYLVKASGQANLTISFEWYFDNEKE